MDFNYTKIRFGNWLYRYFFPLYRVTYTRFKLRNDADEIALLKQYVQPGNQVLDIGANIGFYARLLSRFCGAGGMVYCFEPDAANYRRLVSGTRDLKNVKLFNAAVSDAPGMLNVYKSKLLNVDHRTYPVEGYDSIESTPAVSIDDLIARREIKPPQVIKIDIQGYELAAFRGMEKLLREHKPVIVCEFWPHGFKRAGTSAVAFFDYLTGFGYSMSIIRKQRLTTLKREFVIENNDREFEFSFNVIAT